MEIQENLPTSFWNPLNFSQQEFWLLFDLGDTMHHRASICWKQESNKAHQNVQTSLGVYQTNILYMYIQFRKKYSISFFLQILLSF